MHRSPTSRGQTSRGCTKWNHDGSSRRWPRSASGYCSEQRWRPAAGVSEEGSGNLVTERLALSGFTGIEVAGSWRVTVRPGPYDVQVTVDDNAVDDVRVEVRGDALHFGMRPQIRLRRVTLRAQVTMPALDAVAVSGSGEATFADFESPSLQLSVTGSGDVEGSGSPSAPWLWVSPIPAMSRWVGA